jgi:hypothetical protein
MANVVVKVVTKVQKFPIAAPVGDFNFSISDASGVIAILSTPDTSASFDLPVGSYTASVERMGVNASADFEVGESEKDVDVPDTVSVEVNL